MNDRDEEGHGSDPTPTREGNWLVVALADGIGAFAGGFVAFLAVILASGNVDFSAPVRVLKDISHLFYNSFNVPSYTRQTFVTERNGTVVSETVRETWQNGITGWVRLHQETTAGGDLVDETTRTAVVSVDTALPTLAYLLVPVVVVLAVGLVFGYRSLAVSEDTTPRTLAVRSLVGGSILTVGFLLAALVGTYVTVIEGTRAFRHPARFETLLYGFAYPALLGTVGIAVGQYLRWRGIATDSDSGVEQPPDAGDKPVDGTDTSDEE